MLASMKNSARLMHFVAIESARYSIKQHATVERDLGLEPQWFKPMKILRSSTLLRLMGIVPHKTLLAVGQMGKKVTQKGQ